MKWVENLSGSKEECFQYLHQIVEQLTSGKMVLEGKDVDIVVPAEVQMAYKVKYSQEPEQAAAELPGK